MVSIAAFQAVDPGSIPGRRRGIFFFTLPLFAMLTDTIFYDSHVEGMQGAEITILYFQTQ